MDKTVHNPTNDTVMTGPNLSGLELGDYRVLRRLGHGAMAEVYLAEQTSLKRQVAFKVLRGELASDESYVRRFHNEAQAVASLVHANIVQIYEVGQIEGHHYIAQEYVRGLNLQQLVHRHGQADVELAVGIMRQVLAALHRAGEQGIIHRDIKPDNIMLTAEGEVKVADFGLARIVDNGTTVDMTQVGVTMGTPLYMSPEQAEGKSIDPRSDIYSFGATCYHLLTGHPPFSGESALAVALQHVKNTPPRLENERPDLPGGLCRIVHKMLAKMPEDRYTTAGEILRELRDLNIQGLDENWPELLNQWSAAELSAMAGGRLESTQQLQAVMKSRPTTPQRRLLGILAVGTVIVFLTGAGIGWMQYRRDRTNRIEQAQPNQESSLLESSEENLDVKKKDTIEAQYVLAAIYKTEQSWKAVIQFFPESDPNKSHPKSVLRVRQAKQELAMIHLSQGRYDEALELFDQLAKLGKAERQFRAFGIAGQCIVYDLQGDTKNLADKFSDLVSMNLDLQSGYDLDDRLRTPVLRIAAKLGIDL